MSFPAWLEVAESLSHRYAFPIIYDCHDWLPGFGRIAPHILELERDLLQRADLVVCSSQDLMDRITGSQPNKLKCALIRNATDLAIGDKTPQKLAGDPVRTIGYIGALDSWFDVESVAQMARDHPGWKFVLVGRMEDQRILKLNEYGNVEFVGEVPHSAIAALLAAWDVAMIPFLVNDLTVATNPIKLYEYFSAGLPVISSRLPEVELYPDLVYIADSPPRVLGDGDSGSPGRCVAEEETRRRVAPRDLVGQGGDLAGPHHAPGVEDECFAHLAQQTGRGLNGLH